MTNVRGKGDKMTDPVGTEVSVVREHPDIIEIQIDDCTGKLNVCLAFDEKHARELQKQLNEVLKDG